MPWRELYFFIPAGKGKAYNLTRVIWQRGPGWSSLRRCHTRICHELGIGSCAAACALIDFARLDVHTLAAASAQAAKGWTWSLTPFVWVPAHRGSEQRHGRHDRYVGRS